MAERLTRDGIIEALRDLPADATIKDAVERLMFLAQIEANLNAAEEGRTAPQDAAKRRVGA